MYILKRSMYIETAHILADHPGKCSNMHGHSYKVTVGVKSHILIDQMVMDFSELKSIMSKVIEPFDHALIIDAATVERVGKECIVGRFITMAERPTAEVMAKYFFDRIDCYLPKGVEIMVVSVRETKHNEAIYTGNNT